MTIVVVDTETTGFDHAEDRVVEIAAVRLFWNGVSYEPGPARHCLVDPERSIPVVASAVHHLTDRDVVDARKFDEAIEHMEFRPDDVFVAHNAEFDRGFFPDYIKNHQWVCTWKVAQKLLPDAPAYGNNVLRYHLGLDVEGGSGRDGQPHSAGFDARTTASVMAHFLTKATIEEMIEITQAPVLLSKMPFGKYRGKPFAEIPSDYRRWLKGLADIDRDLRHTLEYHA